MYVAAGANKMMTPAPSIVLLTIASSAAVHWLSSASSVDQSSEYAPARSVCTSLRFTIPA